MRFKKSREHAGSVHGDISVVKKFDQSLKGTNSNASGYEKWLA